MFDNDGTLWCEKPMPIELGFILKRLAEMVEADASLGQKQPWKAAHERDHAWLGEVITKHYEGDDTDVQVLMGGVVRAFAGMTVDEYAAAAHEYVHDEDGGRIVYQAEPDVFDDGPVKPLRIWSRIGRRPLLAAGNSNGDIPIKNDWATVFADA